MAPGLTGDEPGTSGDRGAAVKGQVRRQTAGEVVAGGRTSGVGGKARPSRYDAPAAALDLGNTLADPRHNP
jgi:hypothetical protein